ncbi:AzlC family ABC transporter permease [Rhizobium halophytocola]|uniref:Branched-subunit amino acid permease n=1 Tax=Rhizobium halophytocola TaxID=735519 RepID=A0ABS4E302_9HYPH|nr:AzlC family ABC transporter permease [Rhizobium halophytocola]MBP1852303.1 putative branched-subunit amino acid permease [Rhizobium halophytocola]
MTARTDALKGARQAMPVMLSTVPFAILFGAVAVSHGLTPGDATLMSATIFAGASQLVGIDLFGHAVPAWLVVLSVFAVNFRHILYSAAVGPLFEGFGRLQQALGFFLLTDPQFAASLARSESGHRVTPSWYLAFGGVIYASWVACTAIGASFGSLIGDPKALGIDVLLPVYFLGLTLGFRHRSHFWPIVVVSATAAVLAERLVGSPWHVSIGALCGVALAAILPPAKRPVADTDADAAAGGPKMDVEVEA